MKITYTETIDLVWKSVKGHCSNDTSWYLSTTKEESILDCLEIREDLDGYLANIYLGSNTSSLTKSVQLKAKNITEVKKESEIVLLNYLKKIRKNVELIDTKMPKFNDSKNLIYKTSWAKEFKKDCPTSYNQAISLAKLGKQLEVEVYKNNENGEWLWSIAVVNHLNATGFWMDSKPTKKEAMAIVKQFGWTLVK
jgi:hypothetical protein